MVRAEIGGKELQPVFLHSSFRTGSTWLWSKFRQVSECYCYYEVFNEILAEINFKSILHSPSAWNSHHPQGAPYFSEFSPLLNEKGGVKGYDENMALSDFFLSSDGDAFRLNLEGAYLKALVALAISTDRMPILSCTRSIGRVRIAREFVGGSHILLKRRLLNQWFSYSNQYLNDNPFFLNTIIRTVCSDFSDEFVHLLKKFLEDNSVTEETLGDDHDKILIVFLALHIYLYSKYREDFDLVLDLGKYSSKEDLESASLAIFDLTSVQVDLSDYGEVISAPYKLIDDIDQVIAMVRSLFAQGVPGVQDEALRKLVDSELADFQSGYEHYREIAGSAHLQLEKCATARLRFEMVSDDANKKLAALQESVAHQLEDLSARFEAASSDAVTLTKLLHDAELAAQHEHAHGRSLSEQLTEAGGKIGYLRHDLEQSRSSERLLEQQCEKNEQALASAEAAIHAAQERCVILECQVRQAESDGSVARVQLEAKIIELAAMAQRFRDMETATQHELEISQSMRGQLVQATEQIQQLKVALEQSRFDAVELERRLADSEQGRVSAEIGIREAQGRCSMLDRDIQNMRAEVTRILAELEFVSSGEAERNDAFDRRWSSMISRLR